MVDGLGTPLRYVSVLQARMDDFLRVLEGIPSYGEQAHYISFQIRLIVPLTFLLKIVRL